MKFLVLLFFSRVNRLLKKYAGRVISVLHGYGLFGSGGNPRNQRDWKEVLDISFFEIDEGQRLNLNQCLQEVDPDIRKTVIAAADAVCEHTFDLLGSGPVSLGADIPWHADFIRGHTWNPHHLYLDARPAPYPGGYDIKVPWELSRFHYLSWLGQAYWFTNDEKYTKEFVALITDWIRENPYPLGVNWACAMDVALRAVNWLWGYHYFCESAVLTEEFKQLFATSLLVHGRHIRKNLEVHVTRSGLLKANHYLADILGLLYLGLSLKGKEAEAWRKFSLNAFEEEMVHQVLPDGVDFEASTSYHRLVCEFFLSAAILAQKNGCSFSSSYYKKLEKMLEFIQAVTKPDGRVPLFGDHDNGRAHRLKIWKNPGDEWVDFRYLLGIGTVIFQRDDFALSCGGQWEEAIWLLGNEAVHFIQQLGQRALPEFKINSSGFPQSGFYVMRDKDAYMLVDAGRHGHGSSGGHAHNDVLSFECHYGSQTWILDPGCYSYTLDYSIRNLLRSTAYHNTVKIDDREQNTIEVNNLFSLTDEARPVVHHWQTEEDFDYLCASHSGYQKLAQPVNHHRQFYFHKNKPYWWLIRDSFSGAGGHTFQWNFHLPEVNAVIDGNLIVLQNDAQERFAIELLNQLPFDISITEGFVSSSYGVIRKSPVVIANLTMPAPLVVDFLLYPIPDTKTDAKIIGNEDLQLALTLLDQHKSNIIK